MRHVVKCPSRLQPTIHCVCVMPALCADMRNFDDVIYQRCPTSELLAKIDGFAVWAEGAEGEFELEIKSIVAGPLTETTETQLTPSV